MVGGIGVARRVVVVGHADGQPRVGLGRGAERLVLEKTSFQPRLLLDNLVSMIGQKAADKGLSLHIDDYTRFAQLFDDEVRRHIDASDLDAVIYTDGELALEALGLDALDAGLAVGAGALNLAIADLDGKDLPDLAVVDELVEIVDVRRHGVVAVGRPLAVAMPAQVDRDDATMRRQGGFLLRPHRPIQRKGVQADNRKAVTCVTIGQCDAVDCGLHRSLPSRRCS